MTKKGERLYLCDVPPDSHNYPSVKGMGDRSTLLSHIELNVKLTLKQDDAKNERRSLLKTFSINRRRGSMCAIGAVLGKITQKKALLLSLKQSNFNHNMDQNYSDKRAGEYREDEG